MKNKNKFLVLFTAVIFLSAFFVVTHNIKAASNCLCEDGTYECDCGDGSDTTTQAEVDSGNYNYYDTSTDSGLSSYCDTEEGQNDQQCKDAYDYADAGGTKGSSCVGAENFYSTDSCATGFTCNADTGKCETSAWGKLTGAGQTNNSTAATAVAQITKATTVIDKITGNPYVAQVGDIIRSDGSIVNSSGNVVASAGSVPNASQLAQNPNSTGSGPFSNVAGASGVSSAGCGATGFEQIGGVCFPIVAGLSKAPISIILSNIFSWLMGLFTTIAVMAFIVSGIQYLTSAGDEDQVKTAKKNATYALLGVVVGLSGFVVVKAIAAAISGQSYFF